ncbi:protein spire2-like [Arapaima gigas]
MARSAHTGAADGDSGVSAPRERPEVREAADARELSLEEVLKSYEQPINEEQAWAVCYQCCSGLCAPPPRASLTGASRLREPSCILLHRDGTVTLQPEPGDHRGRGKTGDTVLSLSLTLSLYLQLVQSLGVAIYRALDWGLDDSEERELSPQLERLIERMVAGDNDGDSGAGAGGSATADEGYSGQEEEDWEEEEEEDGPLRAVSLFRQVMALCASRLANPSLAPEHYPAVCRALFLETLELQTFLARIRDAKEMLKKIRTEEPEEENFTAELDALKHRDWARLWVQLMKELRQGVKLKKVQEQQFDPLPTEFRLTPFEMLMQDIRARKYQLRKVMVSERSLPPPPQEQQSLHEKILAEIKQERKLKPVDTPIIRRPFGSLPCLLHACPHDVKSTSCIDLSVSESAVRPLPRPRVLLKAPTLAEMEEMNISEEEESPGSGELRLAESSPAPLKRDRSFLEHDLACLRDDAILPSLSDSTQLGGPVVRRARALGGAGALPPQRASFPVQGWRPPSPGPFFPAQSSLSSMDEHMEGAESTSPTQEDHKPQWMEEFSHPVESLALTVDEVINVRRVLVKAEMEKFLQNKDLCNSLRKGKVCCCCKVKFPLFSWPSTCLLCKRSVCGSCSAKMKIPSKKMAHIPVYTVGFESSLSGHSRKSDVFKSLRSLSRHSVEEEFPHLYAHGCSLRDVCSECTKFVADVISSSRRSLDIHNNTPKKERAMPAARPYTYPHATGRKCT